MTPPIREPLSRKSLSQETVNRGSGFVINGVTAKPNDDGSITLHFGGCEDGRVNCIPVTPDWNYAIRLYQPRAEILDGSSTFPAIEPSE